ncbi:MAG: GGDEF domain-containing protein [Clostridia bacterium]|nr:GGDEF domain-containing protein [Clostridia bacterium]
MPNTKLKKRINYIMVINFVVTVLLLAYAIHTMKVDYFEAIGRRAMTFSMVVADHLELKKEMVDHLVDMEFESLLKSPYNSEFETYVRQYMPASEIKYVYLLHRLKPDQIKYHVEVDEEDYYALKAGTALNTIYLIDAVIDDETRLADTDYQGYTDKDRYTYLHDEIESIYEGQQAQFKFYSDEWGTYITGFAPIYSKEGDYIGLLASDVYMDEYIQLIGRRVVTILLFGLVILTLIFSLLAGFRRINKIESLVADLKSRAYLDEMTGFYNRRTFVEQEEEYNKIARDTANPFAIIMMDIDHFKNINDTYGHPKGDEIIVAVAATIKSHLGEGDYPFRYGGDEFLILSVKHDQSYVLALAEAILESVRRITFDDVDEQITLSIGVSYEISDELFRVADLIHKADEMLYHAKEHGRNQIANTFEEQK